MLVFVAPLSALSFPPVTLPGMQVIDATSTQLLPHYAEANAAIILPENNWSQWTLNSLNYNSSLNNSSRDLIFSGRFPASSDSLALGISRSLLTNLTQYPLLYMVVKASPGVDFGVRFFSGTVLGTSVPLWTDSDYLDHIQGTGQFENVQVNIPQMVAMNIGKLINTLTSVSMYVERSPSSQSTMFSLQISRFEFLNYPFVSAARGAGTYHAIYIDLSPPHQSTSSVMESIQIQGRLNASFAATYAPYFIQGLSVYSGAIGAITMSQTTITFKITTVGQSASSFSDNLPISSSAIIIVAASGVLYQFVVTGILLNYLLGKPQTSTKPTGNNSSYLYAVSLFGLLPVSVVLLMHDQLRKRKTNSYGFSNPDASRTGKFCD
jgi:hypothetical protein